MSDPTTRVRTFLDQMHDIHRQQVRAPRQQTSASAERPTSMRGKAVNMVGGGGRRSAQQIASASRTTGTSPHRQMEQQMEHCTAILRRYLSQDRSE